MSKYKRENISTYRFKPDVLTLIISFVATAVIILAEYMSITSGKPFITIGMTLIIISVLFIISQSLVSVTIADNYIQVNKIVGRKIIYDIDNIRRFSKKELITSVRTFGNGGMFCYWGYYYSRRVGNFFVYAINLNHLALVTTKEGKKYVINYPHELIPISK